MHRPDVLASAAGPDTGGDSWIDHMRRGDFAAAWDVSDRVLRERCGVPCWHRPRHEQYIWNGAPFEGRRVLVRCYHGLGDTVQFIRFMPELKRRAREVIVWAQPELLPVLHFATGIDRLLPLHDGVPDVAYDVDVEIMELPHAFRTTVATLPNHVPYLTVPPAQRMPGDGIHVGLVWRSGAWDDRRTIPLADLAPLAGMAGVHLHALQQGSGLAEWPLAWGDVQSTGDILELARRMRALDLVLSVDSFPLHLAGALGVQTWGLLHADPDWRWLIERDDSPWYPTMRLWRQRTPGDWRTVIERVAAELWKRQTAKGQINAKPLASRF